MKIVIVCLIASLFAAACANDAAAPVPPTPSSSSIAVTATAPVEPVGARPLPGPAEELLYVRADQSIWLYDTLTGSQKQFTASGLCGRWATVVWNPAGTNVAMTCVSSTDAADVSTFIFNDTGAEVDRAPGYGLLSWSSPTRLLLLRDSPADAEGLYHRAFAFYQVVDDELVLDFELVDVVTASPAPDGASIVYYRAPDAPCAPACQAGLVVHNIADGRERAYGDFVPFQWVRGGESIIVQAPRVREDASGYDAFILNIDSGEQTAVPALNGYTQYWVKPDGGSVVFLSREEGGIGLAVLDVATLDVTQIPGSKIEFGSDHIPPQHVALTEDQIYWFDASGPPSPWFSAKYDGTGLAKLGEAGSNFVEFSPNRAFLAYSTAVTDSSSESTMTVATIEGSTLVEVESAGFGMAWRPASTP